MNFPIEFTGAALPFGLLFWLPTVVVHLAFAFGVERDAGQLMVNGRGC